MRTLTYYSATTEYEPLRARNVLKALQEKHPDRDYVVLVNKRASQVQYRVAQVEEHFLDFSEIDKAPPQPERPPYSAGQQAWEDWREDTDNGWQRNKGTIERIVEPIKRKMNP